MVYKKAIYGDDWGMVYDCFNHTSELENGEFWMFTPLKMLFIAIDRGGWCLRVDFSRRRDGILEAWWRIKVWIGVK